MTRDLAQSGPVDGNSKARLRKNLLEARAHLDAGTRAHWDRAIGAHIVAWWQGIRAPLLAVYWPLQGEPELSAAYCALRKLGVKLALPVVLKKDAPLVFASWEPGEAMATDGMGVAVPARLCQVQPPAILIPCLGFNAQRFRLGYGGGFYDRTLATTPRPATVGVAYACMAAQFDSDSHDIALDKIATEVGFM